MRAGCDIFIYVCCNYAVNWKIERRMNGLTIRVGVDFAGLLAPRGFFESLNLFFGDVQSGPCRMTSQERIKITFLTTDGV